MFFAFLSECGSIFFCLFVRRAPLPEIVHFFRLLLLLVMVLLPALLVFVLPPFCAAVDSFVSCCLCYGCCGCRWLHLPHLLLLLAAWSQALCEMGATVGPVDTEKFASDLKGLWTKFNSLDPEAMLAGSGIGDGR